MDLIDEKKTPNFAARSFKTFVTMKKNVPNFPKLLFLSETFNFNGKLKSLENVNVT